MPPIAIPTASVFLYNRKVEPIAVGYYLFLDKSVIMAKVNERMKWKRGMRMEKEVDLSIQIGKKDMFYFLMRHNYSGFSGIFGLVISFGALIIFFLRLGRGDRFQSVILLIIASLFLIVNPLLLYMKAAGQIKRNPMFRKPLQFCINEEGILVSQDEEQLPIPWENVRRVLETQGYLILYLSAVHAYILPKEQFIEQYPDARRIMKEHLSKGICKWKKTKNEPKLS